jgi:hypothetical protein
MRLEQDAGAQRVPNATVTATYDLSCAENATKGCPHGNVHNVHKQPIGQRLALQFRRMKLRELIVSEGPRVIDIKVRENFFRVYPFHVWILSVSQL